MFQLRKAVLTAAALIFGGLLYLGLNWIPVIGPLTVGFIVGYLIKASPGVGFRAGVYSASIGTIALAILLNGMGLFNYGEVGMPIVLLTAWILLIWNLAGIFLSGVGGMLGSLLGQGRKMLESIMPAIGTLPFGVSFGIPRPKRVIKLHAPPLEEPKRPEEVMEEKRVKFVICPHCGLSNVESNKKCGNCGQKL